jgi:hypothetical protein
MGDSFDLADLMGFKPPPHVELPDSVTSPFLNAIKGKCFHATLLSRYGNNDYGDHNPTEFGFSVDGK